MCQIWTRRHTGYNTTVPETIERVSETEFKVSEGRSLGTWVLGCQGRPTPTPPPTFEKNSQVTKGLETGRQERGGGEARRERQRNPGALGEAGRLGLARSPQCLAK